MINQNKNTKKFDIILTLNRAMNELNKKIDSIIKPNGKSLFTKKEFFNRCEYGEIENFPFSRDTYYSYSSIVKRRKSRNNLQSMDLHRFYDICAYTDVSADYLLGFNTSKRKELSAEMVKTEFGLSDKAMERLIKIKKHTPEYKGDLSTYVLNFIFENDDFWYKFEERLPAYLACLNNRRNENELAMARYGITRAFEELIDELCKYSIDNELSYAELDDESPFPTIIR